MVTHLLIIIVAKNTSNLFCASLKKFNYQNAFF